MVSELHPCTIMNILVEIVFFTVSNCLLQGRNLKQKGTGSKRDKLELPGQAFGLLRKSFLGKNKLSLQRISTEGKMFKIR